MTDRDSRDFPLIVVIPLLALVLVVVTIVAYHAGKADGRDQACTTGKVYAIDDVTVRIASSALRVAMLPTTGANDRKYLIDHAQVLLADVGTSGPLQVECR